jgi:hypothetical protein
MKRTSWESASGKRSLAARTTASMTFWLLNATGRLIEKTWSIGVRPTLEPATPRR